jgi:hypothetical protein
MAETFNIPLCNSLTVEVICAGGGRKKNHRLLPRKPNGNRMRMRKNRRLRNSWRLILFDPIHLFKIHARQKRRI